MHSLFFCQELVDSTVSKPEPTLQGWWGADIFPKGIRFPLNCALYCLWPCCMQQTRRLRIGCKEVYVIVFNWINSYHVKFTRSYLKASVLASLEISVCLVQPGFHLHRQYLAGAGWQLSRVDRRHALQVTGIATTTWHPISSISAICLGPGNIWVCYLCSRKRQRTAWKISLGCKIIDEVHVVTNHCLRY